ncbi:hemocytin isoform X2 [Aricia agestis]|uniref:hemocytin isoform X2 n=1 Tax=Aricia agestis TaxID=91739 RepID=UPI001C206DCF|nr:hemocytin isoform X2 [Aricia agestis]
MNLFSRVLILLYAIYLSEAGYYGAAPPIDNPQSDVEAPAYVPVYAKTRPYGRKTSYSSGTKTYSGTKSYSGTKTYGSGIKTTGATKTHYGTKTHPGGTKTSYGEHRTWQNTGSLPTYNQFHNNAHGGYDPTMCEVECQNSGICVDRNTCQCPPSYTGRLCEVEIKPCLDFPPLPANSARSCSSEMCTITCNEGHKFFDGSSVANMRCVEGQWRPARADLAVLSDCEPQCDPPCLNGGVCLSVDTCQCPVDFRGPQCQYSANACDVRKLGFNGAYRCFGDSEKFSCKLSCPNGASFNGPAAELYTCLYSTGVYEPQPIPHCVFEEVVVITPSNYIHSHSIGPSYSVVETNRTETISGSQVQETIVVQDLTPKGGACLAWGGTHYKTFDGKIYSFQSPCSFTLVRDSLEHKFTVAVRSPACVRADYCPSELTIYLEDKTYKLAVDEDGSVVFRNQKRMIPIPAFLPGIHVAMPGDRVTVALDAGINLSWDMNNMVVVEASVLLWNKTEGLCGSLDGNPENDMMTKEGEPAVVKSVMVSSWELNKIGEVCDSSPMDTSACTSKSEQDMKKALQFCTSIFTKDKFRRCAKVMDVSQLLETCQWDYCACVSSLSPEECACRTVSVYATECRRHGATEMANWRDADTCPMKCPAGKVYKACGAEVQPSCLMPDAPTTGCVEGCYCPDGMLLEGGQCVEKRECPCRIRNKLFPPGAVVPKKCNTCTCVDGSWACTAAACGARCGAVGDPHYRTFDGARYDFMGRCSYTLLSAPNVTVTVENVACSGAISEAMNLAPFSGEGKPSCTKAVNIEYGGAVIRLQQGGSVLIDGRTIETLPVTVGDVRIRIASSLFVIVQLPNKVDLWWDGNTRVFVDVPPSFMDQTKGLCGTFNLNQKDDFLTPEGDVEQTALAFANKWKTREFCDDIDLQEPEHPCTANVENRDAAEKYCNQLKGSLFESCHAFVDVQSYYEACVYDMCACDGDISRCLCPILGDYAMACAAAGMHVQWRYHVKECEIPCGGGQQYMVCADSCARTCIDVATQGDCRPTCVEGCACPAGEVLNNNNVCVPVALCPCYHKGLEFKPNYKEVRPGRRERELCTCVGARWECVPATDADIKQYPPAEDLRANCSAAQHKELTACMAEPLTCKNMHLPPTVTSLECRPGCQCKRGYVLDSTTGDCILPADCPCHHGGRSYPDGHTMQEECNTCTCASGKWTCTERPCAGVCGAWGDSHITTFDGQTFDFQGVCTYLLAKGSMDGKDGFSVEIQNAPCGTTGATCSKSVTLKVACGGVEESVSLTKSTPLPDTSELKKIKLRLAGAYVFLDVPSLGVSLQWDRALRVYVKIEAMWKNRVKGICGNYNSDTRDDFQTPTGGGFPETSALIFADSWKLQPTCPKAEDVTDHCKERPARAEWASSTCGAMKRAPFAACAAEVPAGPYVARCESDACACDSGADCDCACAALAAYAHACAQRGVHIKWRTKELCPMQCDEECTSYSECMSPCPAETCDNTLDYSEISTICSKDTCVEGCKPNKTCPEGMVYANSTSQECVPRAKCKPTCMTLADGRVVLEGEIIEEDACHTCRCSQKHRVCSGQPCSTPIPETLSPETTPHDQPLGCTTGWTAWLSRAAPDLTAAGHSVDTEPLPKPSELAIGSPMCKKDKMTDIECRTVGDHKSPKETGLNVECSLERGLVCDEKENTCPDFEIRVLCTCDEEPFQCLNSTHPNHAHPHSCTQFYECTPEATHAALKTCAPGLMYNPTLMVCDWPAAVIAIRPECGEITTTQPEKPRVYIDTTTESLCPPGHKYSECAYACDQLCEHFETVLKMEGKCVNGEKCIEGCVPQKCDADKLWRDVLTCVAPRDCTCNDNGRIVKPGEVVELGCEKCQCLDNALHCDTSNCGTTFGPTHADYILPPVTTTTTTEATTVTEATSKLTEATTKPTETTTKTTVPPLPTTLMIKTTVSPPPECEPDRYKYLLWGDEPLPAKLSASSAASPMFAPQFAKLNGTTTAESAGSWNPAVSDLNQYIQVELPSKEPLYGVVVQGSPLFEQYVTSYELMYGDDGNAYHTVNGPDGEPQVFRGPVDNKTPMKQMLEPPIEAKFIRLRPLTWHEDIAVRLELIGCGEPTETTETDVETTETTKMTYTDVMTTPTIKETIKTTTEPSTTLEPLQCTEPLGVGAELPIDMITVSSNNDARAGLALAAPRGWTPAYSTPGEWIMFNFTSPRNITGIKTAGGANGWVSAYTVEYTCDVTTFSPVLDASGKPKTFPANFDKHGVILNEFRPPLRAQYLKIMPLKWTDNIEMHVEPIGCFEPYPTTVAPPTTISPCSLCPDVPATACVCAAPLYYDGESCVPRDQCPCVVKYMTYEVGATYRGVSCDQCVCKIGGVSDCRPAETCECAPDLVPHLTKDCQCLCEPCANGTRICPTSKLCLPLERWCDGLQDCPDDERDCTTTAVTIVETVKTTVIPTVAQIRSTPAPPTTPAPVVCPPVECPPNYIVSYTHAPLQRSQSMSELPPPRPRYSYQRYYKGGGTKGGTKGGSKGGFSKTAFSKGGSKGGSYGGGKYSQAFTLEKPTFTKKPTTKEECPQFRCVPKLPPPPHRGTTARPIECVAPACPRGYSLQLETVPGAHTVCPQYVCVPPPERPVFCNMTGRTFSTFDGTEYKYDVCYHILARETRLRAWTVLVRKNCRPEGCANELMVLQDDQLVLVKPNMMIEYNGYEYTVEQTSKICFQQNSFDVARLGSGLLIKSRKYKFIVLFSKDGDVKIGVYSDSRGHVDGLCGAFDGDASNDRSTPDGRLATSTEKFASSWAKPGLPADACRVSACPPDQQARVWEMCKVIAEEPLSRCGKVLNLDKWRSICLEKICECAAGGKGEGACRCALLEQLVGECMGADRDVDVAGWRVKMDCPADCPAPLVHYDCYRRRCEPACGASGASGAPTVCPAEEGHCFPGCYCPEGKLRLGDTCVVPADCLDCTCTGIGTPAKYVTFEGDDLPFLGNCTYLAARDTNRTQHHNFEVYVTNGPCEENSAVVCAKVIHLIHGKNVVHISKAEGNKKLLPVINGEAVFRYPATRDWATLTLLNGQDVSVMLPELHVELIVFQAKLEYSIRMPSHIYANRTEGLCGVCAGDQPQLITSNGTATDDFELYGKSWQASPETLTTLEVPPQEQCGELPPEPECVPPAPEHNPCLQLNNADKFGQCLALIDSQPYLEACETELCLNRSACGTLERYAADCARQGVCLDWRAYLCPLACDAPLVYRPCVDCERTCDNNDEYKNGKKCDSKPVEGCFCPEGKVKVNNTCIEPSKCFPCDANKEHYAGDEWQEDACTKCTCSKTAHGEAHVACTTQTCTRPVCASDHDLLTTPPAPDACCPTYLCVLKPVEERCETPKKMDCGFGQVLKQKINDQGCPEFACECMPESECEHIPTESEVEMLEPGMERVVDRAGCCPRARLVCRPQLCPHAPDCPRFHDLKTDNDTAKCCPEHRCEPPKDKCIVKLEWEAAPKGGEKIRTTQLETLKELDSVWLDGPCRRCRCVPSARGPAPQCSLRECPDIGPSDQFVVEPRPVPFACCPEPVHVACRDGDNIYKVGENWTSADNPCESYRCAEAEPARLEKITTVQNCETGCKPGWEYKEAEDGSCCGRCEPVACVVGGAVRRVGEVWRSNDHCTNYTCLNVNGTLQVQSSNETCPEVPESLVKQFVLSDEAIPDKCCHKREPIACRVGNEIYQEGQTWVSSDPCVNVTCARDMSGRLTQLAERTPCVTECARGWRYERTTDECCGRCVQHQCVVGDELKDVGSTWHSPDNCTSYSCERYGADVMVTSSAAVCPDVSACAPADRVQEGCCQVCTEKPANLKTCAPEAMPLSETIGLFHVELHVHGYCDNREGLPRFMECRGHCNSGTLFNNATGTHESSCECCRATSFAALDATLTCADGTRLPHRVASAVACDCSPCGAADLELTTYPTKTGYKGLTPYPTKTGYGGSHGRYERPKYEPEYDIDARFAEPHRRRRRV